MAEETQNQDQLEQIGSSLTKVEKYIEDHKKPILYIVGIIILVICGFFAYKKLYLEKQQDKALAAMWQAQAQFQIDSFQIALNGNENVTGFADIVDEYGRTKAGNLARYYAACCAMNLGQFEDAVKYLKSFSTEDPIIKAESICLLGDAYSELGQYEDAVAKYEKAAKVANHELMSPRILMKAGILYEKLGKKDKALTVYQKIKDEYDGTQEASAIDKYITRINLQK